MSKNKKIQIYDMGTQLMPTERQTLAIAAGKVVKSIVRREKNPLKVKILLLLAINEIQLPLWFTAIEANHRAAKRSAKEARA